VRDEGLFIARPPRSAARRGDRRSQRSGRRASRSRLRRSPADRRTGRSGPRPAPPFSSSRLVTGDQLVATTPEPRRMNPYGWSSDRRLASLARRRLERRARPRMPTSGEVKAGERSRTVRGLLPRLHRQWQQRAPAAALQEGHGTSSRPRRCSPVAPTGGDERSYRDFSDSEPAPRPRPAPESQGNG
jgi:hypothetical protein